MLAPRTNFAYNAIRTRFRQFRGVIIFKVLCLLFLSLTFISDLMDHGTYYNQAGLGKKNLEDRIAQPVPAREELPQITESRTIRNVTDKGGLSISQKQACQRRLIEPAKNEDDNTTSKLDRRAPIFEPDIPMFRASREAYLNRVTEILCHEQVREPFQTTSGDYWKSQRFELNKDHLFATGIVRETIVISFNKEYLYMSRHPEDRGYLANHPLKEVRQIFADEVEGYLDGTKPHPESGPSLLQELSPGDFYMKEAATYIVTVGVQNKARPAPNVKYLRQLNDIKKIARNLGGTINKGLAYLPPKIDESQFAYLTIE